MSTFAISILIIMPDILQNRHLIEVFKTTSGAVYQSNKANTYLLEFHNYHSSFKPGDFLHFRKQIQSIDLEKMLQSKSIGGDLTVLMPHYSDRCFILSVTDVIQLKELLNGATFMLHLNSLVHECLHLSVA